MVSDNIIEKSLVKVGNNGGFTPSSRVGFSKM